MDQLQWKINRYYERLENQRIAKNQYMGELLRLIRDCEDVYGSVLNAPNNSHEMQAIYQCVANAPLLEFKQQEFPDMTSAKVYRVRKSVGRLYELGFSARQISHILEVQLKYVRTNIKRYREARYSHQYEEKVR